ncbi:protein DMP2-like [Coffea arabica]|uniref:Protein DMP2-like n=1 Tax=Coffea arabica TaxID=13443 RepID=A0A6P6WZR9_COFAR|nr:protein DMP2-like [Coffea arabica]XP_027120835.1 protein DMP2-like [Coffea arabica]
MANKASIAQNAFVGLSSLIKLLPTGTVFAYQFLNPLLIGGDGDSCKVANKVLSYILIVVCGLSCFFSSFTDSYTDSDGEVHYGIATFKGFWPNPDDKDLSSYKIRFGDFVHASFALLVFAGVALLNDNSVDCFYPSFEKHKKVVVSVLPTVVGAVSSAVFALFPTKRNYIGYPPSSQKSNPPKSLLDG